MSKVLVTGGSGFIGKEIVKVLLAEGFEVNVFDIYGDDLQGVNLFKGSVLNQSALSKAMAGCEYVVHMAAILGVSKSTYVPVECLDVNIIGTKNVLECCVIHRVKKILFPSSSEVYGEPVEIPVTENTPLQPKSEYGVSKSVAEEYLKAYQKQHGLNYTALRYFNVYGEEQKHSWVMAKFVNNALVNRPVRIFGDGNQVRAFCHVKEAAQATVNALTNPKANNQVFNIGNPSQAISMKDLAFKVLQLSGTGAQPTFIPLENSDRTKEREIFRRIPSIEKASRLLGFQPTISVDEGIRMLITHKLANIERVKGDVESAQKYSQSIKNDRI